MKELSDINYELEGRVVLLVEEGNCHHDKNNLDKALGLYLKAWDLIPDEKLTWSISNWVASCLFSVYFDLENFNFAEKWAEIALTTRSSAIDTSSLIDMGMVCYELEKYEEALSFFDKAYDYGKSRAFEGRQKKYLNYYLENKGA